MLLYKYVFHVTKLNLINHFVVRKYSCISALEISGPCIEVGFPKLQTKATDSKSTNTLHLSTTRLRVCNCSFVCAGQKTKERKADVSSLETSCNQSCSGPVEQHVSALSTF